MKLRTKQHFDAAHRLSFHKGKCRSLHGHRWEVEIEIDVHNQIWDDVIIDFGEIKEIIDKYDHATILCMCDDNYSLIDLLQDESNKVLTLDGEPTAENLALEIHADVCMKLKDRYSNVIDNVNIKVWESPGNGVEL